MSGRRGGFKGLVALATAMVALAITSTANADVTRAQWVAQVDPICQNGQAQEAAAALPLVQATLRSGASRRRRTTSA